MNICGSFASCPVPVIGLVSKNEVLGTSEIEKLNVGRRCVCELFHRMIIYVNWWNAKTQTQHDESERFCVNLFDTQTNVNSVLFGSKKNHQTMTAIFQLAFFVCSVFAKRKNRISYRSHRRIKAKQ